MTERKDDCHLDLEASLKRLVEWLASMKNNDWSPTLHVHDLKALADQLNAIASTLEEPRWCFLEDAVDNPPSEIGLDGLPVERPQEYAQRYQITIMRIREIAGEAINLAAEYPNPRAKPELIQAANYFLHIWLEAGNDRPVFYDDSEAVRSFNAVLDKAGFALSPERARGILATAWSKFDPHLWPRGDDIGRFLVLRQ